MPSEVNVLCAYKHTSGVGRNIAKALGANIVTCGYWPKPRIADNGIVFNYGRSEVPVWLEDAISRNVLIINHPYAVGRSVDKLQTLLSLFYANVPHIEFTGNQFIAQEWLNAGSLVTVRHTLTGHSGKGIEIVFPAPADDPPQLPHAPLYTKYFYKTHEFRVHVYRGQVIDIVQKKKMGEKKLQQYGITPDGFVCNYHKGWVFAHNDLMCNTPYGGREDIEKISIAATYALGLTWAGVDLLARYDANGRYVDAVVCKLNSAPGIRGAITFQRHIEAFKQTVKEKLTGVL